MYVLIALALAVVALVDVLVDIERDVVVGDLELKLDEFDASI